MINRPMISQSTPCLTPCNMIAKAGSTMIQGATLARLIPPSQYIRQIATRAMTDRKTLTRTVRLSPSLSMKGMQIKSMMDAAIASAKSGPSIYTLMI